MPRSPYRLTFSIEPRYAARVRPRALANVARTTLTAERAPQPIELSIAITNDARIRALNKRYRGVDDATDVLSFNLERSEGFPAQAGARTQLGEVVISYPTARRQARAAGHALDGELAHLLVHGVLHLLGYDHESPRDARDMRAREEAILGRQTH